MQGKVINIHRYYTLLSIRITGRGTVFFISLLLVMTPGPAVKGGQEFQNPTKYVVETSCDDAHLPDLLVRLHPGSS